jgi:hypothetical protein
MNMMLSMVIPIRRAPRASEAVGVSFKKSVKSVKDPTLITDWSALGTAMFRILLTHALMGREMLTFPSFVFVQKPE